MSQIRFKPFAIFAACVLPIVFSACTSSSSRVSVNQSGSLPRVSTWTCTDGARLTITNQGSAVLVTDTRGVNTDLPADPPGQRVRFGKTGFALVLDGRNASWFVSGKQPADCSR